jgi:hypothetical protein
MLIPETRAKSVAVVDRDWILNLQTGAAADVGEGFSNANSGECTPMTTSPVARMAPAPRT